MVYKIETRRVRCNDQSHNTFQTSDWTRRERLINARASCQVYPEAKERVAKNTYTLPCDICAKFSAIVTSTVTTEKTVVIPALTGPRYNCHNPVLS